MARRRDWEIIWVVVIAVTGWYAVYRHDAILLWIRAGLLALRRKF